LAFIDIVLVRLGNILAADLKLLEGEYLSVHQSTLTGDSLPVDKKKRDYDSQLCHGLVLRRLSASCSCFHLSQRSFQYVAFMKLHDCP
jgi:magnesium-transporting ATPase (P-type)